MAIAIHNYSVMFAPEIVIFTGSFAASADLFMDSTKDHLEKLLARRRIGFDLLPKLKVSKLDNLAGLVGAAKVAFDR
jgi:predicted NBD/HSP70 family sugar kinase